MERWKPQRTATLKVENGYDIDLGEMIRVPREAQSKASWKTREQRTSVR